MGVTSGTIGTAIKVQNVNSAPLDLNITNNTTFVLAGLLTSKTGDEETAVGR